MPPFDPELLRGVSTYGYELLSAHPDLDTIYVAIGCGSGICGTITARNALGLKTKIVGVVSQSAQTAKLFVEAMHLYFTAIHNLAEGDGNIDTAWFSQVLSGQTPTP